LSVIIPTLNAAACLPATLASLGEWARGTGTGTGAEVVVADGGSADATCACGAAAGARVVAAPRGRGPQLAAGIAASRGDWLLLLHADTRLAPGWTDAVVRHMATDPGRAGWFRFVLDSADARARRLERMVSWRCRRLGLPYGDQGLLIARTLLEAVGGVRDLPLMEDVDLVRRLGRERLVGLDADAVTSAERWERGGWRRRSARNLACLSLWFAGVPPRLIARLYT
jgi:rSAM/selenodomain-associated transferase 2